MATSGQLSGAGGTTGAALTSIGSDLSVSITFQVASELIQGASEAQMGEEVLVGVVLGLAVIFSVWRFRATTRCVGPRASNVTHSACPQSLRARVVLFMVSCSEHAPLARQLQRPLPA